MKFLANPRVLRGFYIYKVKKYGVNYDLLRPQSFFCFFAFRK